jgi:type I restriction enzyme S subunit
LDDLCDIEVGKTPSRAEPAFWRDGTLPWLSIADMNQGRFFTKTKECVTEAGVQSANMKLVKSGTLLLSFKLSIGKVGVAQIPLYTNEAIAALTNLRSDVDVGYIYWALRHVDLLEGADRAAMGNTLNKAKLKDVKIPLPPLFEQRRIALVLDNADALRAKRREAIAKLDQLLQSAFLDMFGDPITNPKGWPKKPLADVVNERTIVTYGIVQAGEEFPGGIPYVRTGDIVDGRISEAGLRRTSSAIASKFSRSRVDAGDIVMSIRATVGTTALVPDTLAGANLTQGTARIAVGDKVDRDFALHHLRSNGTQRWIQGQVKGATFREITLGRLRELPMMVPPKVLQDQFGQICRRIYREGNMLNSSLADMETLFSSLQQQAFAGVL